MRRIKVILAVVAAVVTLMVMAAPAMAQTWWGGSVDVEDCRLVWIPEWEDWFLICELD